MAYFAQIVNDLVTEVIVINDEVTDGAQFAHDLLGGVWVETYMNNPNKNFAAIGYTYDTANNNFISPQPYPSWILDSNDIWQAPTSQPPAPPQTLWNEQLQEWIPYFEHKKN
jgi:hypothetical protein